MKKNLVDNKFIRVKSTNWVQVAGGIKNPKNFFDIKSSGWIQAAGSKAQVMRNASFFNVKNVWQ